VSVSENKNDENLCKLCFENRIDCVLSGCGHHAFCFECMSHLKSNECPLCRKPRGDVIRVYTA